MSADAAAVLIRAGAEPYVVGCTRLELDRVVLLDAPEPYTGRVG